MPKPDKTPDKTSEPVADLLAGIRKLDQDRYLLVERLRRLVLALGPRVTEEVRYGGLLFSAGPPFCAIFSYAKHVALEFSQGATLTDKHKVLEGDGKKRRYIRLEVGADLFNKNVTEYLAQAFAAAAPSRLARPSSARG